MRQRVMIAMALACDPKLLIADEPTTALDVTIQAQILELMLELRERLGMSILLITHDLGVVAEMCDDVVVMYAGRVVERGPVAEVFSSPQHPYTEALLQSIPMLGMTQAEPLRVIRGTVPSPLDWPRGLPVRAPLRLRVRALRPSSRRSSTVDGRLSACWLCEHGAARRGGRGGASVSAAHDGGRCRTSCSTRAGCKKYFPVHHGLLRRTVGHVQAVDGVDLADPPRRDARARRRVGLRQVDARADADPADRADRGRRSSSTAAT